MEKMSIQALQTELERFTNQTSIYRNALLNVHFLGSDETRCRQCKKVVSFLQSIGATLEGVDFIEDVLSERYSTIDYEYNGYNITLFVDLK